MTKKKKGSGKTRTLNTEENRLLLLRLGKTHMNKVAAACGVSDDVIMRMRDRSGTFRLSTIAKVLNGLKGFEKKSVAAQPSVPAINGAPRDFTRILAEFEKAEGSARERSEDFERFVCHDLSLLAREAGRTKDEGNRSRLLSEMLEIRRNYSAYLAGEPSFEEKSDAHNPLDFIEAWDLNFNLGNAVKHIVMGTKVDLEKAALYLKRELGRRSS
tara:strand:- start:1706 stop:2347 length:642 start_codon:yes stop_codon:yes gene_type:complete